MKVQHLRRMFYQKKKFSFECISNYKFMTKEKNNNMIKKIKTERCYSYLSSYNNDSIPRRKRLSE